MPDSLLPWSRGMLAIAASVAAAFLVSALPWPAALAPYQPLWVAMVLIYWCLATPHIIGVGVAWLCGLLSDVVQGVLLGQHALSYALVAWLTLLLYQRIRLFPPLQQAATVFLLLSLNQAVQYLVLTVQGDSPSLWEYWLPALTSALLWPWLFLFLRYFRRRTHR